MISSGMPFYFAERTDYWYSDSCSCLHTTVRLGSSTVSFSATVSAYNDVYQKELLHLEETRYLQVDIYQVKLGLIDVDIICTLLHV